MTSDFLLSAEAQTLSVAQVCRMTEEAAETMFAAICWANTDGKAVCPRFGCPSCCTTRQPNGALHFRC